MNTSKNVGRGKRIAVSVLALTILSQSIYGPFSAFAANEENPDLLLSAEERKALKETRLELSSTKHNLDQMSEILTSTSYDDYRKNYEKSPKGTVTKTIGAVEAYDEEATVRANIKDYDDAKTLEENMASLTVRLPEVKEAGYVEGWDEQSLLTYDDGRTVWSFDIEEPGLYTITMDYFPIVKDGEEELSNKASIERILLIDGKVLFNEARYLTFARRWIDDYSADGFAQMKQTWKTGTTIENSDNDENVAFSDEEKSVNNGQYVRDPGRYFKYDYYNNEIRPQKVEEPKPLTKTFSDADTFYDEPFEFYFSEGTHTLALDASREAMLIKSFTIAPIEKIETYAEYQKEHSSAKPASTAKIVKIDAEFMTATSEQVIYALNDRTSPVTDPQHSSAIRLNTIGGEKWEIAGQWVEWDFEVPEDGLYYIIPRYMQDVNAGLFSSRKVYIDGKEPFKEARNIRFEYSDNWNTRPLGADILNEKTGKTEYTEFKFYLEKGKHTVKIEAVLGEMGDVIREIEESLDRMNEYYRKILMITGTEPDSYLDYNFDDLIPDVLSGMRAEQKVLESASAELVSLVGEKGDQSVILDKIAYLLDIMGNDQDKVAANLSNYKSYIGSLGTWLLTARNQPLTLDYLVVVPATDAYYCPEANAGFFKNAQHEFSAFMNSFFTNYNSVGATEELHGKDGVLEVWITTGRDQAQIIRQMVTEFTNKATEYNDPEGYPAVNLKLIAAGTLLPATLAGMGPDVSMDGDVVGYGVRNATLNLNDRTIHEAKNEDGTPKYFTREDLERVKSRFSESAFVPLSVFNPDYIPHGDDQDEYYSEALYGIPETQNFPMMFYRKDVFAELQEELGEDDVKVPETWDDLYNLIRVLSDKNMEIGLNTGLMQYIMYQNDVPWYKGDDVVSEGMATNLDSDEALDAFKTMCDFFTQYQQPYTYDFANRFRTGEMPLGIADYTLYNQLTVFAPEIKGLWEFVQIPGSRRTGIDENGEAYTYIDHTAPSTVGAMMIMQSVYDNDDEEHMLKAAWNYIDWWTSAEAQGRYGNEQVAIIGTAAKYATANVEALKSQSWSSSEVRAIEQQFQSLEGTPMTPGNYIVARNQNFAFLAVYNDGATPSDAMQSYISDINKELTRKRDEYDFRTQEETLEEYQAEQEERLGVKLDYIGKLAEKEKAKNESSK